MKFEHFVTGFILFGVAVGIFGFYQSVIAEAPVKPAAAAGQQVALATATMVVEQATAVPTIWASPTVNEAATVAQLNLLAADKNLEAAGRQATAIVEAAMIESQALDRKSASDERLAQQAIALQKLINDGKNIDAMMLSFAMRRDEIHLAFEQIEIDKSGLWVEAAWAFGLVCLAVAMVVTALLRQRSALPVAQQTKQVLHVAKPEGGVERIPAPPMQNYESFMAWAGAVVAGETVAVDHWEQSGMFVGNYRKVHTWLVRWKLIMRHPKTGRAVLNATGERVLVEWIVANPLPYTNQPAKSGGLPSVHTGSVVTEAEGEGLK